MKRFVTYLYEYQNGDRIKNVGFIRVDIRNDSVKLEVCIKNIRDTRGSGVIYGLVKAEGLQGIELGEMQVLHGQGDTRLVLNRNDLSESGYSIENLYGIGIRFADQMYLASCWRDEILDEIGKNVFEVLEKDKGEIQAAAIEKQEQLKIEEVEKEAEVSIPKMEERPASKGNIIYRKIDRSEIRSLPSRNWYLSSNSFLRHGFLNYGYLILKKEVENGQEKVWLGVPGFFEKPEMLMATVYGFPNFEAVPMGIIEMPMQKESDFCQIEKEQRPETGIFGAWYVFLQN